jgi:hypothetical protein
MRKLNYREKKKDIRYESPITYHSKDIASYKVFVNSKTNRLTGQKLYVPNLKNVTLLYTTPMFIMTSQTSVNFM